MGYVILLRQSHFSMDTFGHSVPKASALCNIKQNFARLGYRIVVLLLQSVSMFKDPQYIFKGFIDTHFLVFLSLHKNIDRFINSKANLHTGHTHGSILFDGTKIFWLRTPYQF